MFLGLFFPHDTETARQAKDFLFKSFFFFPVLKFEFPTEFAF